MRVLFAVRNERASALILGAYNYRIFYSEYIDIWRAEIEQTWADASGAAPQQPRLRVDGEALLNPRHRV
jgi:hypothetical protein